MTAKKTDTVFYLVADVEGVTDAAYELRSLVYDGIYSGDPVVAVEKTEKAVLAEARANLDGEDIAADDMNLGLYKVTVEKIRPLSVEATYNIS